MKRITLTQSEELKVGERGEYVFDPKSKRTIARCQMLKIKPWVQKVKTPVTEIDRTMRQFIDLNFGYKLEYGITYQGQDYVCGSMPRDLGTVIHGMAIVAGLEVS